MFSSCGNAPISRSAVCVLFESCIIVGLPDISPSVKGKAKGLSPLRWTWLMDFCTRCHAYQSSATARASTTATKPFTAGRITQHGRHSAVICHDGHTMFILCASNSLMDLC